MELPIRFIIRFDGLEAVSAGQAAASLRRTLQDETSGIEARLFRTDEEAMDLGAALQVALAAPAILELAKGISAWLARMQSSKVTITRPDGTIVVENVGARQAVNLAERLQAAHGS